MSQHYYTSRCTDGDPIEVLCGWDRVLQRHFLDISRTYTTACENEEDEILLYTSIADSDAPTGSNWDYFANVLETMNIKIPDEMSEALISDSIKQTGNELSNWE